MLPPCRRIVAPANPVCDGGLQGKAILELFQSHRSRSSCLTPLCASRSATKGKLTGKPLGPTREKVGLFARGPCPRRAVSAVQVKVFDESL